MVIRKLAKSHQFHVTTIIGYGNPPNRRLLVFKDGCRTELVRFRQLSYYHEFSLVAALSLFSVALRSARSLIATVISALRLFAFAIKSARSLITVISA